MYRKPILLLLISVLILLAGIGAASAHKGDGKDRAVLHICVNDIGRFRDVGVAGTCTPNETAAHLSFTTDTGQFIVLAEVQADSFVAGSTTTTYGDGSITLSPGTDLDIDVGTVFVDNANDRVGIGTTSPSTDLHVSGDVRITGTFLDSGNSAGSASQVLSSTGTGTIWVDDKREVGSRKFICGGCALSGIDLAGEDLTRAWLLDADLGSADLSDARLVTAVMNGADLRGANLSGANLRVAALANTRLDSAILIGADLSGAFLNPANLSAANLGGANLSSAHLRGANLNGTDLTGANLLDADLENANLSNARLAGAVMDGTGLSGVTWNNTICPDGTNSDEIDDDGFTCLNNLSL